LILLWETVHGTCALAPVPAAAGALTPGEAQTAFGRRALGAALHALGAPPGPIPRSTRGAPVPPPGYCASISHSDVLAVGLAARDEGWALGVDLEPARPLPPLLAEVLLAPAERPAHAACGGGEAAGMDLLVRFSLKEALYKALDPWVGRLVLPAEVALMLGPAGVAQAVGPLARGEGPFDAELAWTRCRGHVLATARVRPRRRTRRAAGAAPGAAWAGSPP